MTPPPPHYNAVGFPFASGSAETDPIVGAVNGLVKADGAGNIAAAVEDTDYQSVPAEGAFADGDKTKLDGIEAGATAGGGKILQVASATAGDVTSTSSIPNDDTIPQNTEGAEFVTLAFTPQNSSSTLIIIFSGSMRLSSPGTVTTALFVDSTADALSCSRMTLNQDFWGPCPLQPYFVSAGSTSERTYKIRAGGTGQTLTNNHATQGDAGGVMNKGRITIVEVEA